MKIGISSWSCPWAIGVAGYPPPEKPPDAADLLALARETGAEVIQYADNMPLDALSGTELDSLSRVAKTAGIETEAGTRGLDIDNLMRYCDIAVRLGARLVRTLPHDGADLKRSGGHMKRRVSPLPSRTTTCIPPYGSDALWRKRTARISAFVWTR